ncbi:MAG: nitrous oxide reductase accessory protein NosL [Limnochordaceae bacterium]|nr:nitrous oxide reductase accessory protein NosL [Limnochordaceae bacterium]
MIDTHCGLLMLGDRARTAMASDFLFGHTISARTAYYVAGPDLVVCCAPAVLPFGRRDDAQRFCQGFGGRVLPLEQAVEWVRAEMALDHVSHAGKET